MKTLFLKAQRDDHNGPECRYKCYRKGGGALIFDFLADRMNCIIYKINTKTGKSIIDYKKKETLAPPILWMKVIMKLRETLTKVSSRPKPRCANAVDLISSTSLLQIQRCVAAMFRRLKLDIRQIVLE